MTVQEWQAAGIEQGAVFLAHTLATTRPDRQDWKPTTEPESNTRSPLDMASECIDVNRRMAATLRGETPSAPNMERPFSTAEEACEQLVASGRELAGVVRGLDDAALERKIPMPWGEPTCGFLLRVTANNMNYHAGQINLIQRLYGDTEFHIPKGPME